MAAQVLQLRPNSRLSIFNSLSIPGDSPSTIQLPRLFRPPERPNLVKNRGGREFSVRCSENATRVLRTCKNCKTQFDPLLNHPRDCRYHTAHFGGETRRKFESVYRGGTMDTPDSGKVFQYWHCCGSEDPFDPGCTSAPHASYDD